MYCPAAFTRAVTAFTRLFSKTELSSDCENAGGVRWAALLRKDCQTSACGISPLVMKQSATLAEGLGVPVILRPLVVTDDVSADAEALRLS